MEFEERLRVLKTLSDGIDNGTTHDAGCIKKSPLSDYTCPNLLAREREEFFRATPLLMGLSSDLPKNGTYWADNATGTPILMVRDEQGQFRAFVNSCRHRGAKVVAEGRGEAKRFTCPFHAWTYQCSGQLIAVNRESSFGAIDKSEYSLQPLPCAEKYGQLWVRPSFGPPIDVDQCLGGLGSEMQHWDLPDHRFVDTQYIDADINWKLAVDTFGENYHFDVLHRDSLANDIHGNLQTHDIYGRNYRMVFAYKHFKELAKNFGELTAWPYRIMTLNVYFIYPNTIFLVDPSGVDLLRIFPRNDSPHESRTEHCWYISSDAEAYFKQHGLSLDEHFNGFNNVIKGEDYHMAEITQANARSGLQSHILFGRNEPALHHYHNVHREALGRELI